MRPGNVGGAASAARAAGPRRRPLPSRRDQLDHQPALREDRLTLRRACGSRHRLSETIPQAHRRGGRCGFTFRPKRAVEGTGRSRAGCACQVTYRPFDTRECAPSASSASPLHPSDDLRVPFLRVHDHVRDHATGNLRQVGPATWLACFPSRLLHGRRTYRGCRVECCGAAPRHCVQMARPRPLPGRSPRAVGLLLPALVARDARARRV